MTPRFRVEWTDAASTDLANIIAFIAKDSLVNASKIYRKIRKKALTLHTFPNRGHVVPELAELDVVSYREVLTPPYRIVYRIEKSIVLVLAVLDGRRDLREILAERLLRP